MSRHRLPIRVHGAGFTLVEVLVTLVVTAIGLLGVALLLALGVRQQHVSAIHTQATFLGESMMDRMQSNRQAVWTSAYDGVYDATLAGQTPPACTVASPCDPAQRAQRDRILWAAELTAMIRLATATVTCQRGGPVPSADALMRSAPYDGYCDISLRWSEPGESEDDTPKDESVSWRFTP